MPEKTTTHYALPYPTSAGEVKLGAKDFEELALKTDEVLFEKFLTIKKYAGSATLKSGELAIQEKSGETFTLPAVGTANQIIAVWCYAAGSPCKITSGGAPIAGDFITPGATITLLTNQHVVLQSDGTNWLIVAGEPKREQVYGALTGRVVGTEYEPSATREVLVTISALTSGSKIVRVFVGGVEISGLGGQSGGTFTQNVSLQFSVPPGLKWKVTEAAAVESSYLLR